MIYRELLENRIPYVFIAIRAFQVRVPTLMIHGLSEYTVLRTPLGIMTQGSRPLCPGMVTVRLCTRVGDTHRALHLSLARPL